MVMRHRICQICPVLYPLLLVILFLSAPSPLSAQSDSGSFRVGETRITPHFVESQAGAAVAADWIRITTPEAHDSEAPNRLEISALRFPATAAQPGLPIFVLNYTTASSASVLADSETMLAIVALFGGTSDVLFIEPRGIGASRPNLACPESIAAELNTLRGEEALTSAYSAYLAKCIDAWALRGVELEGYTARALAYDVDDLRAALGYESIMLFGIDFGTQVGLDVLRLFEERISRAVFLAVQGPNHSLTLPSHVEARLQQINTRQIADGLEAADDLTALIETLVETLDSTPLLVPTDDPRSGLPVSVLLTGYDLRYALARALATAEQGSLPARLRAMSLGDFSWLAAATLAHRTHLLDNLAPLVMRCASGATPARLETIQSEAATTVLGDVINDIYPALCRELGEIDLGEAYRRTVVADVPTLLIAGSADPLTPSENAAIAVTGLGEGQLLLVDGGAHALAGDALATIGAAITAFVAGEPLEDVEITQHFPLEPVRLAPIEVEDWRAEYYEGIAPTGEPLLVNDLAALNLMWGENAPAEEVPADEFAARFTTTHEFDAGAYRFTLHVDDGARLFVDNVLLIDGWEEGPARTYKIDVNLVQGRHSIRVDYFDMAEEALLRLHIGRLLIYDDYKAEYFAGPNPIGTPVLVRNEAKIDRYWGQSVPAPGLPPSDYSIQWSQTSFFAEGAVGVDVFVDGGVRVWLDNQLLVDSALDLGPRMLVGEASRVEAGMHAFRVEYFSGSGSNALRVRRNQVAVALEPPTALISVPSRIMTAVDTVFNASASVAATGRTLQQYLWDFGDGATLSGASVSHAYAIPGAYPVTLTVVDSLGVRHQATQRVIVADDGARTAFESEPVAVIDSVNQTFVGDSEVFDAAASISENPLLNFDWDFGDGTRSSTQSPAKRFSAPGIYKVSLTVIDDLGQSHSSSKLVHVFVKPLPAVETTAGDPADAPEVAEEPVSQAETEENLLPTVTPVVVGGIEPTVTPVAVGAEQPNSAPTVTPTVTPTLLPTAPPVATLTATPTATPTATTLSDTGQAEATATPTETATEVAADAPTATPTATPAETPAESSTETPTASPTETPTETPTDAPTETPTETPTVTPTLEDAPTETPTPSEQSADDEPTGGDEEPGQVPQATPNPDGSPGAVIRGRIDNLELIPERDGESIQIELFLGDVVTWSAAGSVAGSAAISAYAWDFGDGLTTSADVDAVYTYQTAGAYQLTLTVTDVAGVSDSETWLVLVFDE